MMITSKTVNNKYHFGDRILSIYLAFQSCMLQKNRGNRLQQTLDVTKRAKLTLQVTHNTKRNSYAK